MVRDHSLTHVSSLGDLLQTLVQDRGSITALSMPMPLLREAILRGFIGECGTVDLKPYFRRFVENEKSIAGAPLVGVIEASVDVADDPLSEPSHLIGSVFRIAATAPIVALEYACAEEGPSRHMLITRDSYPCPEFATPFRPGAALIAGVEEVPGPWRWTGAQMEDGEWTPTSHGGCFRTFNDALADARTVSKMERVVDFVTAGELAEINKHKNVPAANPEQLILRFKSPSLYTRFSGQGAPLQGEKGYRAPPLDGRAPAEIAQTAFDYATRYMHDPDFFYLLDPDWLLEWGARVDPSDWDDPAEEIRQNKIDLADWLDLPHTDVKGRQVSVETRSDFGHYVYALAKLVDGSAGMAESPMTSMSSKVDTFGGDGYPVWAATGEIEDALQGPGRLRLVFVPQKTAFAFIKRHHSRLGEGHRMPPGTMYSIGVMVGEKLVAVATAGHPTGAPMRRGPGGATPRSTLQLTRVASDGSTKNAASMLVGRILDILERSSRNPSAPSLFVTYSLWGEPGTPYRALRDKGLRPVCVTSPAAPSGARSGGDGLSRLPKIRWEAGPDAAPAAWDTLATGKGPKCKGLFR